jgi:hypothetical protein
MSKVIEGAEVHGSMFEVWRYWWGDRCWRKADVQRPTPVCSRTRLTQRIARNFLERRTSLDPLPFRCYRWQNRCLARATSQRLHLRLAIALG